MELTLHIGHFKTGSTAIQMHFDRHRKAYARQGWLYPESGKPMANKPNHSGLAFQELDAAGRTVARWYRSSKEYKRYKRGVATRAEDAMLAEVRQKQPDHLLVSSEEFIQFGGRHGVPADRTRALVASFGANSVHIVCYLRRPDRYLESWYNQRVKLGVSVPRLADDLAHYLGSVHVQYFDAVSYWTNLVGADRVSLLRYDDVRSDLISATIDAIGAPRLKLLERRREPVGVNPRLPDAFVEFARIYNEDRNRRGAANLRRVLTRLAHDPEIASTPVYFIDGAARRRLYEAFRPIDQQLAVLAGTGNSFFPDLEDMVKIDPTAISDVEAFERWAAMALQAVRDDAMDRGSRPGRDRTEGAASNPSTGGPAKSGRAKGGKGGKGGAGTSRAARGGAGKGRRTSVETVQQGEV